MRLFCFQVNPGMEKKTADYGRTGYLTLSPFEAYLPMIFSKLKETSPEGPFHH